MPALPLALRAFGEERASDDLARAKIVTFHVGRLVDLPRLAGEPWELVDRQRLREQLDARKRRVYRDRLVP